jgi:hypothetical protein
MSENVIDQHRTSIAETIDKGRGEEQKWIHTDKASLEVSINNIEYSIEILTVVESYCLVSLYQYIKYIDQQHLIPKYYTFIPFAIMLRSIPCKLSGESLRNASKLNFSLDFTDKAFPAKSVLPQSKAQIIERHDTYMRSLTTIVLVCVLVAKAASGIRIPDWETCE